MIISTSWLLEWIDISSYNLNNIIDTFNKIGLEVKNKKLINIPPNIVVGYVTEVKKHPNADKLNICKVNIGTSVKNVVCGANNVREGIHVAFARIGTIMPNGLNIKPVEIRGVYSEGMICSALELGLDILDDEGILVLDDSIGKLEVSKEIKEYKSLNDEILELELTPNRGDCLSVRGVARELSASYGIDLNNLKEEDEFIQMPAIGRFIQLNNEYENEIKLSYMTFDKKGEIQIPLLLQLRLSFIKKQFKNSLDAFLNYLNHSIGVVFRAYSSKYFLLSNDKEKTIINVSKDKDGLCIVKGNDLVSIVGVRQVKDFDKEIEGNIILEASYIPPKIISKKVFDHKIKIDELYYKTSRGSEPDLKLGVDYCKYIFKKYTSVDFYAGFINLNKEKKNLSISFNINDINSIIGFNIDKVKIVKILKSLNFAFEILKNDVITVLIPKFRHDITNKQDICEEILRMIGIDNIPSKALDLLEKNVLNDNFKFYKKTKFYREKVSNTGFFECINYIFTQRSLLEKYNIKTLEKAKDLLNPITENLNTLRPTLLLGLLKSASRNISFNKKSIALFEIGTVFNEKREEKEKLSLIFSGLKEEYSFKNRGKSEEIDFNYFIDLMSKILGNFDLEESDLKNDLANPYQFANILINKESVGTVFKLKQSIVQEYNLLNTYLCELDFEKLPYSTPQVKKYSKYPIVCRDLSILINEDIKYKKIKEILNLNLDKNIVNFYPIDIYKDNKIVGKSSLTIRFDIQSYEKTLKDEDINLIIDNLLKVLFDNFGAKLR